MNTIAGVRSVDSIYLRAAQNRDGGFPSQPGAGSNAHGPRGAEGCVDVLAGLVGQAEAHAGAPPQRLHL